jgi:hypothetical protein
MRLNRLCLRHGMPLCALLAFLAFALYNRKPSPQEAWSRAAPAPTVWASEKTTAEYISRAQDAVEVEFAEEAAAAVAPPPLPVGSGLPAEVGSGAGSCVVHPSADFTGGDIEQVEVIETDGHSVWEACCDECARRNNLVAVLCGGTCFMKSEHAQFGGQGQLAASKKDCAVLTIKNKNFEVDAQLHKRTSAKKTRVNENDRGRWLPTDTESDAFLEAIPRGGGGSGKQVTAQSTKQVSEAWALFRARIRHNMASAEWADADPRGARDDDGADEPVRILVINSAVITFGMNWMSGEHIQWPDLVYGLAKAGHQVELAQKLHWPKWLNDLESYDLILCDYAALTYDGLGGPMWPRATEEVRSNLRCKLRVVDTYGTSARYNERTRPGAVASMPALGLRLDQYFAYYPDVAPGSSFAGFTVTEPASVPLREKKWQAVIWGKDPSYMGLHRQESSWGWFWGSHDGGAPTTKWLEQLCEHIPVFATVQSDKLTKDYAWPSCVTNVGLLSTGEYQGLLAESALLVGVGQPFYGNAPLDALLHGAMVLLPTFAPSIGRCPDCVLAPASLDFELGKHTKRRFESLQNDIPLTSQNPYIEALGAPDVWTTPTLPPYAASQSDAAAAGSLKQTLGEINAEFLHRMQSGGYAADRRSRLPREWRVQSFADRLNGAARQNYCRPAAAPHGQNPH